MWFSKNEEKTFFPIVHSFPGGYSEEVTPVPIPNTVVKLFCAEGTWDAGPWEIRTPPGVSFEGHKGDPLLFLERNIIEGGAMLAPP